MAQNLIEFVLAPLLVAASGLASQRWSQRVGGVVSAFPAIVGPVLLITVLTHGPVFTARVADGTILGLVSLSGFAAAYARGAVRLGWVPSVLCGWGAAALAAATVATAGGVLVAPAALGVATAALLLAYRSLPSTAARRVPAPCPPRAIRLPARMIATALLVTVLAAAARVLGPLLGGVLPALPVLASALAVFTHRRDGATAAIELLRGMLAGMTGFVAFCELVALTVRAGPAAAFVSATMLALAVQVLTACCVRGTLRTFGIVQGNRSAAGHRRPLGGVEPRTAGIPCRDVEPQVIFAGGPQAAGRLRPPAAHLPRAGGGDRGGVPEVSPAAS